MKENGSRLLDTAKEMFEKMQYIQKINNERYVIYKHKSDTRFTIIFDKKYKELRITRKNFTILNRTSLIGLYLDDLQAINKQVEELG